MIAFRIFYYKHVFFKTFIILYIPKIKIYFLGRVVYEFKKILCAAGVIVVSEKNIDDDVYIIRAVHVGTQRYNKYNTYI